MHSVLFAAPFQTGDVSVCLFFSPMSTKFATAGRPSNKEEHGTSGQPKTSPTTLMSLILVEIYNNINNNKMLIMLIILLIVLIVN